MSNAFIKQLKDYLNLFQKTSAVSGVIKSVAEYLYSQQHLLDSSKPTLTLLDALGNSLNGGIQPSGDIYIYLLNFWLHRIRQVKADILYIGNLARFKKLVPLLNASAIGRLNFLSAGERSVEEMGRYFNEISASNAPFIIYDPDGVKLALSAKQSQIIGATSLFDILIASYIPVEEKINQYTHQLVKQYCALANQEVRTVIIGNSHSYYAFPDALLGNSVNMSTHSLGLKQAQQLAEHIVARYPKIENFIFSVGFFDLYSDLLNSNNAFNQLIIHAFSQLNCRYGICADSLNQHEDAVILSELIVNASGRVLAVPGIDDLDARKQSCNAADSLLTSTAYLPKDEQDKLAKQRGISHSGSLSHAGTLEENKVRVKAMVDFLAKAGKKVVWLTPPFPAEYNKHIIPEMTFTHRQFFAQLNNKKCLSIDLSESKDFHHHDFRDGDHLNFTGASKLIAKLRKINIPL